MFENANEMFVEKMASIMINFNSSDDSVNDLIEELYYKSIDKEVICSKSNKKKCENHITDIDMFILGYAILLYEYISLEQDNKYEKIIKKLYYKLNDMIYPDKFKDKDIQDIKANVKLEYEK